MVWLLRDILNFLAGVSGLVLLWWGPTTLKPKTWKINVMMSGRC
jgi:hypothetical protein